MDTLELEKLHRNYLEHNTIQSCFEYYRSNYTINTIHFTSKEEVTEDLVKNAFSTQTLIEVDDYFFNKNVLNFYNFSFYFYDRFIELKKLFIEDKKITNDEKIYELTKIAKDCKECVEYHLNNNRFSILGDINTYIISREGGYLPIQAALLGKKDVLDRIRNDYQIRYEFFSGIYNSIYRDIAALKLKLNEELQKDLSIKSKNRENKYIVYELVAALCHSDYFEIPESEKKILEKKLLNVLNIEEDGKRSDRIDTLRNKKTPFVLEKIVAILKSIKRFD